MYKDQRLIVTINAFDTDDIRLRDRIEVAAKTLGVSKAALMKACLNGALDCPNTFHPYIGLKR